MRINAVHFQPYIYNTNYINRNSLNRIDAISDDLLSGKTDFSELVNDDLNENPLHKGETADFAHVLQMQFQKGQLNASRLIRPAQTIKEDFSDNTSAQNPYTMQRALEAYQANMTA